MAVIANITARKQVERAEREQRALVEALTDAVVAINSTLDLEQILDRILANVGQVIPHDFANIMLVEEGVAHVVGHRGYDERGAATGSPVAPRRQRRCAPANNGRNRRAAGHRRHGLF
ncbi:MAG: hypothetical protein M5U29_08540 [Anaerolineae bacterium]|nr:hypothetical protein [Anaerolineae bacterium]